MNNKIIILTGPSCSGKTTIANTLVSRYPDLFRIIKTYTTRNKRNELDDLSYHFVNEELFKELIKTNMFIEYEQVYNNKYYGTSNSSISNALAQYDIKSILCIDVLGALKLKNLLKDKCLTIYCDPKSWDTINTRIEERGLDENINERKNKYNTESKYQTHFDFILNTENDINITIEDLLTYFNIPNNYSYFDEYGIGDKPLDLSVPDYELTEEQL